MDLNQMPVWRDQYFSIFFLAEMSVYTDHLYSHSVKLPVVNVTMYVKKMELFCSTYASPSKVSKYNSHSLSFLLVRCRLPATKE